MSFAQKAKAKNDPFFIYLPTNVPHRDNNVPSEWLTPYLDAGCNLDQAAFYAGIERVDWNMGRLMKFWIRKPNWLTLLLFLTDNGSILPQRKPGTDIDRISGMRGMKGKLYEGGHRVPCFIRGPEEVVGNHAISMPLPPTSICCPLLLSFADWLNPPRRFTRWMDEVFSPFQGRKPGRTEPCFYTIKMESRDHRNMRKRRYSPVTGA